MIVTFCGHGRILDGRSEVQSWVRVVCENLIVDGAKIFYLGEHGEFDMLVALVLNELKEKYREIEIVLILEYLNRKYEKNLYDYTLYPDLESTPKRFAILKRNEYMVNSAEVVIAYVLHGWGGAAKTLEFAKKKKKKIIQFSNDGVENSL